MAGGIPQLLACDTIRLARFLQGHVREKLRPARSLHTLFREKVRPARHKTPILGHFSCAGRTISRSRPPLDRAGRTFSRTGSCDVTTLKPTTPLQPLMQTNVKPASPMQPKTTPKTPISHPQRRRRFHSHTCTSEQRRRGFQTDMPNNISTPGPTGVEGAGGTGGPGCGARGRRRALAELQMAGRRYKRRQTNAIPITSRGPLLQTSSIQAQKPPLLAKKPSD